MNDLIPLIPGISEDGTVTVALPRTTSFGGGIEETRISFQASLIGAYTVIMSGDEEKTGCGGGDFSSLIGDNNVIGVKNITISGSTLDFPNPREIFSKILEDTASDAMTVIIHPDE